MDDKCKKGEVYNTKIKKCISKRESKLRKHFGGRYDTMSQQQRDLYPTKIDSFKQSTKSDSGSFYGSKPYLNLLSPTETKIKANKLLKKSIEHDYPKLKKKKSKKKRGN